MTRLAPLLLLLACAGPRGPDEGTAVGNPGKMALTTAADGDPSLTRASASVQQLVLRRCDGTSTSVPVQAGIDLLAGSPRIDVPPGTFCAVDVVLAIDGLDLAGATSGGTTFTAVLDPGTLFASEAFAVDGDDWLIWLPIAEAVDPATLEDLGADVTLQPEDATAQSWAAGASAGVVYEDVDGSGSLTEPDALPESPAAADSAAGCGCTSGAGAMGAWPAIAGLLLGLRRRAASSAGTRRRTRRSSARRRR